MDKRFQYKAWANSELIETMLLIDSERYPEERKRAIRLLNHAYVVDRIFAAHLVGQPHDYRGTNTVETPALEQLRQDVAISDAWYAAYASRTPEHELRTSIRFAFADGGQGTMSKDEILFHVLAHGAYHRGNIGMLLDACGIEQPRDTFTRFVHSLEPARRK